MTCIFFGHKDAPSQIKENLKSTIIYMINIGVKQFYVGNNGSFDFLVQSVLKEVASTQPNITYNIVISFINERPMSGEENVSLFPEGLENSLPKFAISKRNEWLLKNGSYAIVYMKNKFSNCYKWVQKASKKGICVINLADNESNQASH